ncbi:type I-E CRISPR-associated protein Cas6/Cse3/CasE [Phycicoccus sp. CSK15P-2]|uniref:type I-E CRISPR-associated protein Cas6/Cse3/CasE n=1 Tax=Phycicoccus sp. CSK15P-2 TaxID=2807627 RepID=UPI0019527D53|nr:type I-E CRISPR-associated protein Cas6/Cse3/CasE [Phycicoccus sp. CSK15P-2]MBM6404831.1 type I-E CRISPR-associated protein Cas6/Cse3/CasE [Phycicoccus sp. CSK15P-2]
MPYLSRVPLNPLRRHTQRLLTSPQRLHAEVLGGLPEHLPGERVLWRLDPGATVRSGQSMPGLDVGSPHVSQLYVLTQRHPSWAKLVDDAGWPDADGGAADVRDYESLLGLVVNGREFSFRLRANPVWRTRNPQTPTDSQTSALTGSRARGVRVAALSAESQLQWLVERTREDHAVWGFSVEGEDSHPRAQVVARNQERFRRRPGDAPVTIRSATYEGLLTVVDADRMRESLVSGVGGGKAYGCGLLTLAPGRR